MPAIVTILYPVPTDCSAKTFDLEYYKAIHMPLVWKSWHPKGLQSYQIIRLAPETGFLMECLLTWESVEAFEKAKLSEEAAQIMRDIVNFAAVPPSIFVAGEVVEAN